MPKNNNIYYNLFYRVLNESMSLMILTALLSYICFNIYIFAAIAFVFDFGFRGI